MFSVAETGFVAQMTWWSNRPLPQTDLWHSHRDQAAELGKSINQYNSYLKFGDLTIKFTRHTPFTQKYEVAHFGFDLAAPVVTTPSFPDASPQPLGDFHDFVSCFCTGCALLPDSRTFLLVGMDGRGTRRNNRRMAGHGIVSPSARYRSDGIRDWSKQHWQAASAHHRCCCCQPQRPEFPASVHQ